MRHLIVVAVALVLAPSAAGSITVATNASQPALLVDKQGNAEVSWTSGGKLHTLLVPVQGRVRPGVHLSGGDAGSFLRPTDLPFAKVVRAGAGGWVYAVQSWRVLPSGPAELRFARWRGNGTVATLQAKKTSTGVLLTGKVTFDGRAVPTTSRTPEGKVLRQYAYVEQRVGGGWKRLGGVAVRADGTFRRLAPGGSQFRVLVPGPNIGRTYAPDALATATLG
jgi:hypothetical protein